MAEFKVYDGIDGEITAMLNAGLDTNLAPADLTTFEGMKTVGLYYERYKTLKQVMGLYSKLLQKDANDLQAMIDQSRSMDTTIGSSYTTV